MVVACTRPARPSFFTLRTCAPQIPHRCAPGARWRRPCHKTVTRAADQANAPTAVDTTAGLIFKTGEPGSWDDKGLGHPVVRYYLGDNEQRWYMWYTGRSSECPDKDAVFPSSGSIGVAVSKDGIHWTRGGGAITGARGEARSADVGKVLSPNPDWWWHDTCHLHAGDVQILSSGAVGGGTGIYWMFYSGGSYEEVEVPPALQSTSDEEGAPAPVGGTMEGLRLRPGLAMSQDGRNWARIEADHHTGALFDVGEPGEWDELFIGTPQVVAVGPRDMRMYYHSFDQRKQKYVVGVATSKDGFKWDKQGPMFEGGSQPGDFDAAGAASRQVVRDIDTKQFFMFYEGVAADGTRSIGLAVSKDGLKGWKRYPQPILSASEEEGAWDSGAVGTPCAVSMAAGRWRLYYAGRQQDRLGGWQGIGVALSQVDGPSFEGAPVSFNRRKSEQQ